MLKSNSLTKQFQEINYGRIRDAIIDAVEVASCQLIALIQR